MTKKQGTSKYSPHSSSSLRSRQGKPNQKRLPKWRPLNSDAVVDLEHHFYDSLKLLLDDDERSRLERIRPIYWRIVEEIRRRKNEFKFPDFVRQEDFEAAVKEQGLDEFFDLLKKAVDTRKKSDVMALLTDGGFWVPSSPPAHGSDKSGKVDSTRVQSHGDAVTLSWTAEFVGDSLDILMRHVRDQMGKTGLYARYSAVIQSSGMGKSRLLDEFSKHHFLIPMNLRPEGSEGFPPPDNEVRNFLTTVESSSKDPYEASISRARRFLEALFSHATQTIGAFTSESVQDRAVQKQVVVEKFRDYMSDGQGFYSPGPKRSAFYSTVIKDAKKNENPTDNQLRVAFDSLRSCVRTQRPLRNRPLQGDSNPLPDVFILFDEAHQLTAAFSQTDARSNFAAIRQVLQTLNNEPMFTFFLSTTGKILQFTPPRHLDASDRINKGTLNTPPPFVHWGFDLLMKNRKIFDKYTTLDDVTSLDCIAHMGRPLWGTIHDNGDDDVRAKLVMFACGKLLGSDSSKHLTKAQKYAVLSHRLVLDTTETRHIMNRSSPSTEMELEQEQISNHLRVCVSIGDGFETIRGITPSEPILSEAASFIMRDGSFKLADALAEVLNGYSITANSGDRAELLVSAFFTWARDRAVSEKSALKGQLSRYFSVTELFESLFSESVFNLISTSVPLLCGTKTTEQTFGQIFKNAFMHFSHFVKPQEQKLLAQAYLPSFMARGAAVLGANCQPGVDAVYPYLYNTTVLSTENVGFILVQVKKNDVPLDSRGEIFKNMNPFKCGILQKSDHLNGNFKIPIIRIVFALCEKPSTGIGVSQQQHTTVTEQDPSHPDGKREQGFIAFDFWCSGIDPKIIKPVKEAPERWKALVERADSWHAFYRDAPNGSANILRSQYPACGSHVAHFNTWANLDMA